MGFTSGLEKTAVFRAAGKLVGGVLGVPAKALRLTGRGILHPIKETAKGIGEGAAYTSRALSTKKPLKRGISELMDRKRKIDAIRAKNTPSFAVKHPFLAGLGAYGLAHQVFKDSAKTPEERVYNPNS